MSSVSYQRATGASRIVIEGSESGTRLVDVFQKAPLRVIFPVVDGERVAEAVLVNTAGGIAGGDRLDVHVTALPGASIAVTSQAAEKVYRALGEPARVTTTLTAHASARVAWLPQETIVFDGARLRRCVDLNVTSGAEVLALEWLVLGRAARGENVRCGHLADDWRVRRDGRLIWADAFLARDETFEELAASVLLADCRAVATLVYVADDVEPVVAFVRETIADTACRCGATLVSGLVVIRLAARASIDLTDALRAILRAMASKIGSPVFRIPKMWSC